MYPVDETTEFYIVLYRVIIRGENTWTLFEITERDLLIIYGFVSIKYYIMRATHHLPFVYPSTQRFYMKNYFCDDKRKKKKIIKSKSYEEYKNIMSMSIFLQTFAIFFFYFYSMCVLWMWHDILKHYNSRGFGIENVY